MIAVLTNAAARIEDIKHVQPVPRNHPPGFRVTFTDYDSIDLSPEDGKKLLEIIAIVQLKPHVITEQICSIQPPRSDG